MNKSDGKAKITNALWGLLLALSSYVIIVTLGGDKLVNFDLSFKNAGVVAAPTLLGTRTQTDISYLTQTPTTIPQADASFPVNNQLGGPYAINNVRNTWYSHDEPTNDQWTTKFQSSTGVRLRYGTASTIGVAAVDPTVIPYGSYINNNGRWFLAADTGGLVKGNHIDYFSNTKQIGPETGSVTIIPYRGTTPFRQLSASQKESFFNINNIPD
jgi:3D (Asp-Asp-Asp) domain-containing protein